MITSYGLLVLRNDARGPRVLIFRYLPAAPWTIRVPAPGFYCFPVKTVRCQGFCATSVRSYITCLTTVYSSNE